MKISRIASTAALITLAILGASTSPRAAGLEQLSDNWAPVGPFLDQVLLKVYATRADETAALLRGDIDLTSSPLTLPEFAIPSLPPNIMAPLTIESGFFDLEFNLANTHFGIPFDHGNNPAGIHLRQALAHLIDKKALVSSVLEGAGAITDDPVSPAQGVPVPDFHLYDPLHGPSTISAFNLVDDPSPAPAPDSPDWLAAKEHLIAAGFMESTTATPGGNLLLNPPSGTVDFFVRSDDPRRMALGNNLAAAWNSLFVGGAGGLNMRSCDIIVCFEVVLDTTTVLDWHWYTGGFRLGPTWLHLFSLYHSQFASNECGGRKTRLGSNYIFVCTPELDDKLTQMVLSPDIATSLAAAKGALLVFGQHEPTIPVWSPTRRFGFLSGWTGIINAIGIGPPNSYTLLNALCGPNVGTTCPTGADSKDSRLRWGSLGTTRLNIFEAYSYWEKLILSEIYDSLLTSNPLNPHQLISNMADEWKLFFDGIGLGYRPPAGTKTTIRFQLRPNIFFHDGTRLTPKDVRFTIINFRDFSATFPYCLHFCNVIDVKMHSPLVFDVHFNEKGPFVEFELGLAPILNSSVWDTNSDGVIDPGKQTEDAVASGLLAKDGSGPYAFVSTTGGDQMIVPGDTILFKRFGPPDQSAALNQYFRASGVYKNFDWTDVNDDASLKVDIVDVASVALCVGKPATGSCAYWDTVAGGVGGAGKTPLLGQTANVVDIIEFSAVAANFGQTWLFPQAWSTAYYKGIKSYPFIPPGP